LDFFYIPHILKKKVSLKASSFVSANQSNGDLQRAEDQFGKDVFQEGCRQRRRVEKEKEKRK